jgi:hypothetical protein
LIVKFNSFYYEHNGRLSLKESTGFSIVSLDKDFAKTKIKNIIHCGIYDILIYDKHVKIFNNINPMNELDEIVVDDYILELL